MFPQHAFVILLWGILMSPLIKLMAVGRMSTLHLECVFPIEFHNSTKNQVTKNKITFITLISTILDEDMNACKISPS